MKKGDFITTPRYGEIRLQAVYESLEEARKAGYKEDTWYKDPAYGILGKDLGKDLMAFAAYKR